ITDPAARVLVDAVQEVLARPEEPDGRDRGPQNLEVFRQEALPKVLAEREQEDRYGDRDDVGLEPEGFEARGPSPQPRPDPVPAATSRIPIRASGVGRR